MYIPNADNVYVGLTDGRIFRLTWNAPTSTWGALTALTTPRPAAYVSDFFVDPANLNRIWVTSRTIGGSRVFRSDDAGVHWLDRTAGLPGLPINAIAVDPVDRSGCSSGDWAATSPFSRPWAHHDLWPAETVDLNGAHVGRDDPEPAVRQDRDLVAPQPGRIRPAVQQHGHAVLMILDLQRDPVGRRSPGHRYQRSWTRRWHAAPAGAVAPRGSGGGLQH
jgi:hypothetical protein